MPKEPPIVGLTAERERLNQDIRKGLDLMITENGTPEIYLNLWRGIGGVACVYVALGGPHNTGAMEGDPVGDFLGFVRDLTRRPIAKRAAGLLGGRAGVLLCAAIVAKGIGELATLKCISEYLPRFSQEVLRCSDVGLDFGGGIAGILCSIIWISQLCHISIAPEVSALTDTYLKPVLKGRFTANQAQIFEAYGLAHGDCGMALCLLEIGLYSNEHHFIALAKSLLEGVTGRMQNAWRVTNKVGDISWCHGASGIAAFQAYVKTLRVDELFDTSFELTRSHILRHPMLLPSNQYPNSCLCHGFGSVAGALTSQFPLPQAPVDLSLALQAKLLEILQASRTEDPHAPSPYWPTVPTAVRGPYASLIRSSYFCGVGGISSLLNNIAHEKPQGRLLMPF